MTDYDHRLFPKTHRERALEIARNRLPDRAELAIVSHTGGRAFGWGTDKHDWDVHGFFVCDDWFRQVHSDKESYDMTLRNIDSFERPRWETRRFKQFYDKGGAPIFINEKFDYEGWFEELTPETVLNVFPHATQLQLDRLHSQFNVRSACHTYKELMIPLHFLLNGDIEPNVVHKVNPHDDFQYDGLDACAECYGTNLDLQDDFDYTEEMVWGEIHELWDRLEQQLVEQAGYEP